MPSEKNIEGYDLWSSFYDAYPNPTVAADELSFPAFWSAVTGKRVLEVGCGTGRHTSKLLQQGNEVVGLDQSAGMLGLAKEKLGGREGLQLIEADFLSYDFGDASFDAIVVSLVLEHFRDPREFLLRCSSLLSSDGRMFLSEIHPDRGALAHFKGADGEEIHLESYVHSEKALRDAAAFAGLRVVECVDVMADARLPVMQEKWKRYEGVKMLKVMVLERN